MAEKRLSVRELCFMFDSSESQRFSIENEDTESFLTKDVNYNEEKEEEVLPIQQGGAFCTLDPNLESFQILDKTLKKKNNEIEGLQSELMEVRSLFEESKKKLQEEALKKTEFKQRCKCLEKALDEMQLKTDPGNSNGDQRVQLLREQNKSIFGVVCRVQGELSDERERNERFTAKIEDISGIYESLQEKTVDLMKFNDAIQQMMVKAKNKQLDLESELDTMLQTNKDLLWVMCKKEDKWAHAQENNALLTEKVKCLMEEQDRTQKELALSKKAFTDERKKIASLESELDRIKSVFAIKIQANYRGMKVRQNLGNIKQFKNVKIRDNKAKNTTNHKKDKQGVVTKGQKGGTWGRLWKRKKNKQT